MSATLNYATVDKTREKGRVTKVAYRVVFGTVAAVLAALRRSYIGRAINTAFVEQHNATDRHHNVRTLIRRFGGMA